MIDLEERLAETSKLETPGRGYSLVPFKDGRLQHGVLLARDILLLPHSLLGLIAPGTNDQ